MHLTAGVTDPPKSYVPLQPNRLAPGSPGRSGRLRIHTGSAKNG